MAPPGFRPGPDPVLSPRKESPQCRCSVRKARAHPPEARCGAKRGQEHPSGRSSCYPRHPEAGRVAGPEQQVAEGEPSGPKQAGLTLPTRLPPSFPRLSLPCQRAPEEGALRLGGRDAPGPGVPPAVEEAPSGPAPDLSPRLTPQPAAAAAGRPVGVHAAGLGRAGAAGTRARAAGPGDPSGAAEPGHGVEPGRGARQSRWLPAVRDRVSLRTQVSLSLNNTRWPTRRHARHVTARPFRHAPRSAPAPPRLPPSSSSLPRHPSFPIHPSPFPRTRPYPSPGCRAGRGRGRSRAQALAGRLAGAPCLPLS